MIRTSFASRVLRPVVVTLAIGSSIAVFAQPPPGGGDERGGRRGPPPEAVAACRGRRASATCSFDAPHGRIEGTCRSDPDMQTLACVPSGPPPGRRGAPPPRGNGGDGRSR